MYSTSYICTVVIGKYIYVCVLYYLYCISKVRSGYLCINSFVFLSVHRAEIRIDLRHCRTDLYSHYHWVCWFVATKYVGIRYPRSYFSPFD